MLGEANSKTEGKASRLMELNIVCEMEKQMKAMDELHRRMITGLKIEWDNEKRKLSLTRHLVSGAPVPKDVVFPITHSRSADVSWNCDEEELCEEDKKKVAYSVEVKKITENEDGWKEVYRGKEKKCSVS